MANKLKSLNDGKFARNASLSVTHMRAVHAIKRELFNFLTPARMLALLQAIFDKAVVDNDMRAAQLLLDHSLGRPKAIEYTDEDIYEEVSKEETIDKLVEFLRATRPELFHNVIEVTSEPKKEE